jgi:glycosyltransferase involved in cell wall biosynthesis
MTLAAAASTTGDLRVLHVIASVDPAHGGPSTAIWNMMDALRLTGVESDLATTDPGTNGRHSSPMPSNGNAMGHRVISFRQQTRFYAFSATLLAWLASNTRRYDLVEAHGLFNFPSLAAAWWARASGVPYVIRPCGVLNSWARQHRRPRLKRASLSVLEGGLLRDAAFVHFTSRAELEQAAELGIRMQSLVLPLGFAAPEPHDIDHPDFLGRRHVLFLGRIAPEKNLDLLMHAFGQVCPRFPDVRLAIAGDGPRDLVELLKTLASGLGIAQRIDWLGFVQGADKEAALRRATMLAMPSASENFGVSAVEALARGVPVVVSRGVGIADRVDAGCAGLVCDATVDDLARCLAVLLGDSALRRELGAHGRRLFETEFSLQPLGASLRSAFEAAVDRRRIRGSRARVA